HLDGGAVGAQAVQSGQRHSIAATAAATTHDGAGDGDGDCGARHTRTADGRMTAGAKTAVAGEMARAARPAALTDGGRRQRCGVSPSSIDDDGCRGAGGGGSGRVDGARVRANSLAAARPSGCQVRVGCRVLGAVRAAWNAVEVNGRREDVAVLAVEDEDADDNDNDDDDDDDDAGR
ncbi:hypothetical protein HK405_000557, partial [Cladochytrium tenue]